MKTSEYTTKGTIRVLHVITDTNRRGAQVFATQLSAAIHAQGDDSRVVALVAGAAGAQLPVRVLGARPRGPVTLWALRREMCDAAVVVAHGSATLSACSLAGLALPVPVVYRNISDPSYWMGTAARRLRVRSMLSRVSHVVALWPGGADFLVSRLGMDSRDITVIPNGVPVEAFRVPDNRERVEARTHFGIPASGSVLVYAAALQPEKHPEAAVHALADLPDSYLLVLGDGPLRRNVTALADRVAPGRVILAGQVADPRPAYWAADIIVLPSEGEGLPAVLIEAGLCGVPAVACAVGGVPDVVVDGVTGYTVSSRTASELGSAISKALDNLESMGTAARQHCLERYAMESVTPAWRRVLHTLS